MEPFRSAILDTLAINRRHFHSHATALPRQATEQVNVVIVPQRLRV